LKEGPTEKSHEVNLFCLPTEFGFLGYDTESTKIFLKIEASSIYELTMPPEQCSLLPRLIPSRTTMLHGLVDNLGCKENILLSPNNPWPYFFPIISEKVQLGTID
jgi:hypothetical protein